MTAVFFTKECPNDDGNSNAQDEYARFSGMDDEVMATTSHQTSFHLKYRIESGRTVLVCRKPNQVNEIWSALKDSSSLRSNAPESKPKDELLECLQELIEHLLTSIDAFERSRRDSSHDAGDGSREFSAKKDLTGKEPANATSASFVKRPEITVFIHFGGGNLDELLKLEVLLQDVYDEHQSDIWDKLAKFASFKHVLSLRFYILSSLRPDLPIDIREPEIGGGEHIEVPKEEAFDHMIDWFDHEHRALKKKERR